MLNEYNADQTRIVGRHLPPRHFKLSYLVTAWTQRPEDEHRLLSALLVAFLKFDAMPADLLAGPLAEIGLPVPLTVGLPPPEDRGFADVWSALGGELKPSIDVVVSAPINTGQQFPSSGRRSPRRRSSPSAGRAVFPATSRSASPSTPWARTPRVGRRRAPRAEAKQGAASGHRFSAVTGPMTARGGLGRTSCHRR